MLGNNDNIIQIRICMFLYYRSSRQEGSKNSVASFRRALKVSRIPLNLAGINFPRSSVRKFWRLFAKSKHVCTEENTSNYSQSRSISMPIFTRHAREICGRKVERCSRSRKILTSLFNDLHLFTCPRNFLKLLFHNFRKYSFFDQFIFQMQFWYVKYSKYRWSSWIWKFCVTYIKIKKNMNLNRCKKNSMENRWQIRWLFV